MNKKTLTGVAFVTFAVLTLMPAAQANNIQLADADEAELNLAKVRLTDGAVRLPSGSCVGQSTVYDGKYYQSYSCIGVYREGTSYVCVGTYRWNSNSGEYCQGVQY